MQKKHRPLFLFPILAILSFSSCKDPYGTVGGADGTITLRDADMARILDPKVGIWYSHYANRKLDSYRIFKWKDRDTFLPDAKLALFPAFDIDAPTFQGAPAAIDPEDYILFYDDTVYETAPGDGGNGGWAGLVTRYIGVVRAVNLFQSEESGAGAVIIEYIDGCYPTWDPDIASRPFFGVYFRVLKPDCIQMANAVELERLYAGQKYYTETATLDEAIAKNNADNDGEFIAWGVVIPQDRPPPP